MGRRCINPKSSGRVSVKGVMPVWFGSGTGLKGWGKNEKIKTGDLVAITETMDSASTPSNAP
jgi:hypothetical protein